MLISLRSKLPFLFNLLLIVAFFSFCLSRTSVETLKFLTLLSLPIFLAIYYKPLKILLQKPLVFLFSFFIALLLFQMDYGLFLHKNGSLSQVFFNHLVVVSYFFIALGIPFLAREKILLKTAPFLPVSFLLSNFLSIRLFNASKEEFSGGLEGFPSIHGKILSVIFVLLMGLSLFSFFQLKRSTGKNKWKGLLFFLFLLAAWITFGVDVSNNKARSLFFIFLFVFVFLFCFSFFFSKKLGALIFILCLLFISSAGGAVVDKLLKRSYFSLSIPKRASSDLSYSVETNALSLNLKPLLNVPLKTLDIRILSKETKKVLAYPSRQVLSDEEVNLKNIYDKFPELFSYAIPLPKNFPKTDYFLDVALNYSDGSTEEIYYNLRPFDGTKDKTFSPLHEKSSMPFNIHDINFSNFYNVRFESSDYQRKHIWLSALSIAKKSLSEKSGLFNFKKDFVDPAVNDYALLILHMTDNRHYHAHNNFLFFYSGGTLFLGLLFIVFSLCLFFLSLKKLFSYARLIKKNDSSWNAQTHLKAAQFITFYGSCFLVFCTQQIYGLFDLTIYSLPNDVVFWVSMGFLLRLCIRKNLFNRMLRSP